MIYDINILELQVIYMCIFLYWYVYCTARHSPIAGAGGEGRHPRSSHNNTAAASTTRSALQQVFSELSLSSLGSSFTGLVRRQASTTSTSTSGQYSSLPTAIPTNDSSNFPIATSTTSSSHIETVNSSSDGSVTGEGSRDYLLKVRVCTLIDMTSLLYRSVLPITWWMAYFRSDAIVFSFITQILYITIKSYDWSRKAKGAIHAGVMFFTNKIVSLYHLFALFECIF